MVLPKLKKCCFCVPLEIGCVITGIISLAACITAIALCSWKLPEHRHQQNEDNLILLNMTMFATLSATSNLAVLAGIALHRPSYLQLALLSNSVFILCILMVSGVTLLFSPTLRPYMENPANVALIMILLISASIYALYYLTVVNSLYAKMQLTYGDSAIPV